MDNSFNNNFMWIPHFGYTLWPREDENCKQSDADTQIREFIISFFIEDTDTREIKDSDIKLDNRETREITIFIENKPEVLPILFENNQKNRLSVIRCKVNSDNKLKALYKAYNPVARTLSFWSFAESACVNFWALAITDEKYKANWEAKPQYATPFVFALPKGISFDKKFNAVFSLYKEGRTNRSPFYRFFCYAKILESFYAKGEIFKGANQVLEKNGLDPKKKRADKKISRHQLVMSLAWPVYKDLEDLEYTKFWVWIRDNYRHLVGHAFPGKYTEEQWLDLDDFKLYTEFSILGNIVDLVITDLIEIELDLYQELADRGFINVDKQDSVK